MVRLVFLGILLVCAASAWDSVMVVAPTSFQEAHKTGFLDIPAMFGFPKHGESLTGLVVDMPDDNLDGCKPYTLPPSWPHNYEVTIALVNRGGCYFVTKVRNAQQVGVDAVIVVNNQAELVRMADDGSGADITIPSMLIYQTDGAALRLQLNSTKVVVALAWNQPSEQKTVIDWRFWLSSFDPVSATFAKNFAPAAKLLGAAAPMTPQYLMFDGEQYGCTDTPGACGNLCLNDKYCATDPDGPHVGLEGRDIVNMNLFQFCVFTALHQDVWFEFVVAFNDQCNTNHAGGPDFSNACATGVLSGLGYPTDGVTTCITSSFVGQDNTILDKQLAAIGTDSVYYLPSLLIDDEEYTGNIRCDVPLDLTHCQPLRTICDAFPAGQAPAVCASSVGCALGQVRDACGICGGNGQMDACGVCLSAASKSFNRTCAGCDGVPNSGVRHDACGVCGGSALSFAQCVQTTAVGVKGLTLNVTVDSEWAAIAEVAHGSGAGAVQSVNLTLLADLALMQAQINDLRASLNKACFNPTGAATGAQPQAVECPAAAHSGSGDSGGNQTTAIVVAVFIVGFLLAAGVGFIVWRRRRNERSSSLDEDNTSISTSSSKKSSKTKGKHQLLRDDDDDEESAPARPVTNESSFTDATPLPKSKAKAGKKAKGGDIKVPLMDTSNDDDL